MYCTALIEAGTFSMKRFLVFATCCRYCNKCLVIVMIESGIYSLNYYDYPDDDIAVQREYEIGD